MCCRVLLRVSVLVADQGAPVIAGRYCAAGLHLALVPGSVWLTPDGLEFGGLGRSDG